MLTGGTALMTIASPIWIRKNWNFGTTPSLLILNKFGSNGFEKNRARALIDMATTGTNLISNNFCYQNGIKSWSLPEPLTMSLALKGSRSKLQREALATLQLGIHEIPCKFRLTNLDK